MVIDFGQNADLCLYIAYMLESPFLLDATHAK